MSVPALEEFTRRHYQLTRFPVAASRGIIILVSPRRLVYIVKHTRQVMVSISSLVCEFMVVMMIRLLNLTFDSNLVCILYYYHKENVVFHSLKPGGLCFVSVPNFTLQQESRRTDIAVSRLISKLVINYRLCTVVVAET